MRAFTIEGVNNSTPILWWFAVMWKLPFWRAQNVDQMGLHDQKRFITIRRCHLSGISFFETFQLSLWHTEALRKLTIPLKFTCLYVPSSKVSRFASGAGVLSLNLVNSLLWMVRNCWARCAKSSRYFVWLRRCCEWQWYILLTDVFFLWMQRAKSEIFPIWTGTSVRPFKGETQ